MLLCPVLTVVQITDPHLFAEADECLLGWPTRPSFERVLAAALAEDPDLLLLTGDVSQDGSKASYRAAASLVRAAGVPCGWVPGNHDDAAAMKPVLTGPPFLDGPVIDVGAWRFVLVDSHIPGEVSGEIGPGQRLEIERAITSEPSRPVCLVLHHPPLATGSGWLDPLGLRDADALLALVNRHRNVRLVLFGHVHQEVDARHGEARLLACPSTCIQFAPRSADFALGNEPPGYRVLRLTDDGRVDTAVVRVALDYAPHGTPAGY